MFSKTILVHNTAKTYSAFFKIYTMITFLLLLNKLFSEEQIFKMAGW